MENYNNKLQEDLIFGSKNENVVINILNKKFNCNFIKTNRYNHFDFVDKNEKIAIELKSRRINKYKYPTTMIGFNKVVEGERYINKNYRTFFIFNFLDGLFYYEIAENSIEENWIQKNSFDPVNKNVYIPCNLLNQL